MRFQFNLKMMLALTLLAGGLCGLVSQRYHARLRQRAAVRALGKMRARLTPQPFTAPVNDDWLSQLTGAPPPATVRSINVFADATDADMHHVAALAEGLQRLSLLYTDVTDDGLKHLAGLNRLTSLSLSHSPVSDAGLRHLHSLTALEDIWLQGTDVTAAGADELRRALPHCRVHGR